MSITNTNQTVTVDGVTKATLGAITQDPNTGQFLRSLLVYDVDTQGNLAAIPKYTLILSGATQQAIEVETPAFSF